MTIDRRTLIAAAPALLATPAWADEAPAALKAYEKASGGRVGLYAENLVTGAKLAWRADERFVMCSTFKASLAACVLHRVDKGQERLDRLVHYSEKDLQPYAPTAKANLAKGALTVAEMCKAAVELSDNTCANKLLEAIGGPAALTKFWRETGDTTSRLDHNEPVLNRSPPGDPHDTTTPRAMAQSIRRFVLGKVLSDGSRERLTDWMIACQTGANRLRAGLPKAWMVGDKTGNNGSDACGDLAVAWQGPGAPILIACYVQGGKPKPADQDAVFKAVGRMVGERLKS
jgi:beta-lactamase class A